MFVDGSFLLFTLTFYILILAEMFKFNTNILKANKQYHNMTFKIKSIVTNIVLI